MHASRRPFLATSPTDVVGSMLADEDQQLLSAIGGILVIEMIVLNDRRYVWMPVRLSE